MTKAAELASISESKLWGERSTARLACAAVASEAAATRVRANDFILGERTRLWADREYSCECGEFGESISESYLMHTLHMLMHRSTILFIATLVAQWHNSKH